MRAEPKPHFTEAEYLAFEEVSIQKHDRNGC